MSLAPEMIRRVSYPPERLIEARPINLAANAYVWLTELAEIPPYLVRLVQLGQERRIDTDLAVDGVCAGSSRLWTVDTDALPDIDWETYWNAYFDDRMGIRYYSTANVSNYRARAIWEVRNYSVADKLAMGVSWEGLFEDERDLAEKYQVLNKIAYGTLPMEYPEGPLLYEANGTFVGDVAAGATGEQTVYEQFIEPGSKIVLRYLYANRPTVNVADLEVRVYRERKPYFTVYPHCLVDYPTEHLPAGFMPGLWVPALSHLRVSVYSGTGHTGVIVGAKVDVRRLTVWDKINWGLLNVKGYAEEWERAVVEKLSLDEKFKAGIYEPVTPIDTVGV